MELMASDEPPTHVPSIEKQPSLISKPPEEVLVAVPVILSELVAMSVPTVVVPDTSALPWTERALPGVVVPMPMLPPL